MTLLALLPPNASMGKADMTEGANVFYNQINKLDFMKKLYFLFVVCLAASQLWAQPSATAESPPDQAITGEVGTQAVAPVPPAPGCPVADAGPDVTTFFSTVIGPSIVIPGATYSWSPATWLNNPNSPNPIVRRRVGGSTGTYTYTLTLSGTYENRVVNGDFSQGNTGFSTQYTYISPGTAGQPNQYTIATNPVVMNHQWCNVELGNNLMIIDGSPQGNSRYYWSQTVTVQPNTNYTFAFDAMSTWSTSPAFLGASINGTVVVWQQLTGACGWQYPQVVWNSGSSTTANIVLYTFSLIGTGNDFAVDNIRLTGPPCPITTDEVNVTFESLTIPPFPPCDNCTPIPPCESCPPIPPCRICPTPFVNPEVYSGEISVYPNPAQRVVNVTLGAASGEDVRIEMRDRNGRVVRSIDGGDIRGDSVPVELQGLPDDIYTISVRSGNNVTVKRFIVKH